MLYCVRYKDLNSCSVGYIRPWNSVRDEETYSLTYLPTSFIDGIEKELDCKKKILRHKLRFNGMTTEFFLSPSITLKTLMKNGNVTTSIKRDNGTSTIHQLCEPEIILGFEDKEDAINASTQAIYVGQTQYMIYPIPFDYDSEKYDVNDIYNDENMIREMNEEEFSALVGTETFPTTKEDENGVYCGNNRFRNDERMYITIVRTKNK